MEGNKRDNSIIFSVVNSAQNADFNAAMDIYTDAFPLNEKQPEAIIKERVNTGLNTLYVGQIDNVVVFMALLWPLKDTSFILLEYMATSVKHKGRNIASCFLVNLTELSLVSQKYFILEIEHPDFGENKMERLKRMAFYRKNGAKELKDVRYLLPPLHGQLPTEMMLMIFPGDGVEILEIAMVKKLIAQIYKEVYNRGEDDALLQVIISSLHNRRFIDVI